MVLDVLKIPVLLAGILEKVLTRLPWRKERSAQNEEVSLGPIERCSNDDDDRTLEDTKGPEVV